MRKEIFAFALTAAVSIVAAGAAIAAPGSSTSVSSTFATSSVATPSAGSGIAGGGGGGGRGARSSGGRIGSKGVWTNSAAPQTGAGEWVQSGSRWWYRYSNGGYATNWAKLSYNGKTDWYFFDNKGWMQTGWLEDNTGKYYLNPVSDGTQGRMITGTYTINGVEYHFETQAGNMQGHLIQ